MENAKDKITLRAIEPEDLNLLYSIENDRSVWNIGTTNVPYSRFVLRDYIVNSANDIYTDKQLRLIIENGDGKAVGTVDLVNFDPRHLRAEVGILICNKYRGRGYAKEALMSLVGYSRDILQLHQLYAYSDMHNIISLNLFKSVGFTANIVLKEWLKHQEGYTDAVLMQYFL